MDDLISRKTVLALPRNKVRSLSTYEVIEETVNVTDIEHLPPAQSEIVRCKDCKYWREWKYVNGKPKFLPRCGFHQIYTGEDDFCSKAERREE